VNGRGYWFHPHPVVCPDMRSYHAQALDFSEEGLASGCRVLVHCNHGQSRSATIALLYMASRTDALPAMNADEARAMFSQVYPPFQPGVAMRHFLITHWKSYSGKRQ